MTDPAYEEVPVCLPGSHQMVWPRDPTRIILDDKACIERLEYDGACRLCNKPDTQVFTGGRHAGSCSNQNVLDPYGAYKGADTCGCNSTTRIPTESSGNPDEKGV